ncbi:MAG: D-alanyl-D-alanine carboxypeptidase/D-alanyl-D-alanine-endopeptidase [Pseudomonadota bacterium]
MLKYSTVLMAALCLASACTTLPREVDRALDNPDQAGTRWGILVQDETGNDVFALRAEERFLPASNTKIVLSMAGYHHAEALADLASFGTRLVLREHPDGVLPPDLILLGGGDAGLGDGPECETTCLATLADQFVEAGIKEISSVIGDDTLFPDERWAPGWSQEDLQFHYGTAVSALSVNDNTLYMEVEPAEEIGERAKIVWQEGDDLYSIKNELITVTPNPDRKDVVRLQRDLASTEVRVFGQIAWNSEPRTLRVGVHDPARLAAERFKRLLEARGIDVVGDVGVLHRPLSLRDDPEPVEAGARLVVYPAMGERPPVMEAFAVLPSSSLAATQAEISKNSNNLHSELLLRRLGLIVGTGSRAQGLAVLDEMLIEAGVPEGAITLSDGTGMSIYNKVTPAGLVKLLDWARDQDWGAIWRADQPIAGVDGSLERRFRDTWLEGRLFAKTGTLNGVNALSGYMIAQSGRELIFSIIANDRPPMTPSATDEMQDALLAIAARH